MNDLHAGMIQQFLTTVQWGELDYLVIDTPPGTSDEHLAVLDCLKEVDVDGAVLVTTPQVRLAKHLTTSLLSCTFSSLEVVPLLR